MTSYLVSYRPLAISARGRLASKTYDLPLFADGSCRREPDFESAYPSISALCRKGYFAPKLQLGDEVLYITVKSSFGLLQPAHHKLVAHLKVVDRSESHQDAAAWYQQRSLPPPSNCMLTGSKPKPYEQTNGRNERAWRRYPTATRLQWWDGEYRKRASDFGVFVHCEAKLLELHSPSRLFEADFKAVFDRVPGTRNPPAISNAELQDLVLKATQRGA